MEQWITETKDLWQYLQETEKPILLYGMGDGAVKIKQVCDQYGIPIAGIFASDAYVRGHEFLGFPIKTLAEMEAEQKDFIILLAFAAFEDSLYQWILTLSQRHELYAPDVPVIGEGLFTMAYWKEHCHEFSCVYEMLADSLSRKTLVNVVSFKLSGKIAYLDAIATTRQQDYAQLLPLQQVQCYVDLGAYDGDTVAEVLSHGAKPHTILALEPDSRNYRKLQANTQEISGMECHLLGSYSHKTVLSFHNRGGRNSAMGEGGRIEVPVNSVDNLLEGRCADFIKMDVEGAEYPTLQGCADTIQKFQPMLAIAAYHRNEDLFALPLLLQQLSSQYVLYLRHNQYIPAWETIFYAVPKSSQTQQSEELMG